MTVLCFVDTNVLVYSRDASEPKKQPKAQAWRDALWKTRQGRLSAQVLNEYYQVVTRRLKPGLDARRAREEINDLFHWQPVSLSAALLCAAFEAEDRWRCSFWDSLIIAAAHEANCQILLSEDFQDGQELDGLRVVNPFKADPSSILGVPDEA